MIVDDGRDLGEVMRHLLQTLEPELTLIADTAPQFETRVARMRRAVARLTDTLQRA